jgi:hydrogenase maturation factor
VTITENNNQKTVKKVNKKVEIKKYPDLEGKFLIVKVGTKEDLASDKDIKEVQDALVNLLEVNDISCLALVSGHDIDMKIVEKLPDS